MLVMMQGKGNTHVLLVEVQIYKPAMKVSVEVPQKAENRSIQTFGDNPSECSILL